jgi:hypothetical protein
MQYRSLLAKGLAMRWVLLAAVGLALAGCVSTSQVFEVGPDTYSVSSTADGYRTASSARQSALESGTAKCVAMGRHFVLTNESTEPTRMGIDTTVTLTFRCPEEGVGASHRT